MGQVVVGVDGSAGAETALRWAAAEAVLHDRVLVPVMAFAYEPALVTVLPAVTARPTHEELAQHAENRLRRTIDAVGTHGAEVRPRVMERSAADAILEAGADAALVTVGTRGLGGFRGLLLGSVSRQVVAGASVPVAVIPPGASASAIRSVVVGVDGSPQAAAALRWAAAEAADHGARLEVVHATPFPPIVGAPGFVVPTDEPERVEARAVDACQTIVRDVLGSSPPGEVRSRGAVGHAARRLLEEAEEADMLVVGRRGLGTLAAGLLGSTSNAVIAHAPCPTVVVPS
jgi:nucleotide-binding universal stress UspA family protein